MLRNYSWNWNFQFEINDPLASRIVSRKKQKTQKLLIMNNNVCQNEKNNDHLIFGELAIWLKRHRHTAKTTKEEIVSNNKKWQIKQQQTNAKTN